MKTQKILFTLALLVFIVFNAQAQSFDCDASSWHKKAIMTCGMVKSTNPDTLLINKNLAELEAEFQILFNKYYDNPSEEYAKDVNWNFYLLTLKENLTVVKERVEEKNYKAASVFCPYFCTTFGKIHKINGTTDLTDLMFAWRAELKNTTEMFNVGNLKGASQNSKQLENLYQKVVEFKSTNNNPSFNELFNPLDKIYSVWISALKDGNASALNETFSNFMKTFPKAYLSTLNTNQ